MRLRDELKGKGDTHLPPKESPLFPSLLAPLVERKSELTSFVERRRERKKEARKAFCFEFLILNFEFVSDLEFWIWNFR